MSTVTGYAVYDKDLERFITGVHPDAKAAEAEAGEAPKGAKRETRKV